MRAIVIFLGSQEKGARCLSPLPRLGLPPGSLPPFGFLYFRQSSDITANLFSPNKPATKPSHILKKGSTMFCFIGSVNLTADRGLLQHVSLKGGKKQWGGGSAKDCEDSLERSVKAALHPPPTARPEAPLLSIAVSLVRSVCRPDSL